MGVVERIVGTTVFLKQQASEAVKDGVAIPMRFLKQPFDVRHHSNRGKVEINGIFCIVKDSLPLLDYNTTSMVEMLELKKLESVFGRLPELSSDCCEDFGAHYTEAVRRRRQQEEIDSIKLRYNVCSLGMIDEYNQRIVFLERRRFIKDGITLKD